MDGTQLLGQLASALASGAVEVVDLSAPLGPDTPLIKLPPEIGKNTPPIEIHAISHYDKDGPFWAWNWLKLGEHSGTHFDAPVHWISGKDHPNNTTDTIPAKNFVGPACVIDCSAEATKNNDFLLTVDGVKAWEKTHGDIPANSWVLMRTDWYKRNDSEAKFLNVDDKGPHSPGPTAETIHYLIGKGSWAGARRRSAPMPARPAAWTRPSRRTLSCTRPTAMASPACATSTGCRPRARS